MKSFGIAKALLCLSKPPKAIFHVLLAQPCRGSFKSNSQHVLSLSLSQFTDCSNVNFTLVLSKFRYFQLRKLQSAFYLWLIVANSKWQFIDVEVTNVIFNSLRILIKLNCNSNRKILSLKTSREREKSIYKSVSTAIIIFRIENLHRQASSASIKLQVIGS